MKSILRIALCLTCALGIGVSAWGQTQSGGKVRKPSISDTIRANIYGDNTFVLYINGELVAVDSIGFIPHNVISVDILPAYPMTIAVMAKDNADPKTGMEYANTNIGDGGFVLKFGDGTVTNATWKAKNFRGGQSIATPSRLALKVSPFPTTGMTSILMTARGGMPKSTPKKKSDPSSLTMKMTLKVRSSFGQTTLRSITQSSFVTLSNLLRTESNAMILEA